MGVEKGIGKRSEIDLVKLGIIGAAATAGSIAIGAVMPKDLSAQNWQAEPSADEIITEPLKKLSAITEEISLGAQILKSDITYKTKRVVQPVLSNLQAMQAKHEFSQTDKQKLVTLDIDAVKYGENAYLSSVLKLSDKGLFYSPSTKIFLNPQTQILYAVDGGDVLNITDFIKKEIIDLKKTLSQKRRNLEISNYNLNVYNQRWFALQRLSTNEDLNTSEVLKTKLTEEIRQLEQLLKQTNLDITSFADAVSKFEKRLAQLPQSLIDQVDQNSAYVAMDLINKSAIGFKSKINQYVGPLEATSGRNLEGTLSSLEEQSNRAKGLKENLERAGFEGVDVIISSGENVNPIISAADQRFRESGINRQAFEVAIITFEKKLTEDELQAAKTKVVNMSPEGARIDWNVTEGTDMEKREDQVVAVFSRESNLATPSVSDHVKNIAGGR